MNKYIYSIIALLMITFCPAQMFVSQAEYFWDTDPGLGNGTAVLAADGNFNSAFEQLTKTGITTPSSGLHKFCMRIKDNSGVWGPVFTNIINVQQNPTSTIMAISQAEYFWDTDPGVGNGTAVLAADGNFDSSFEQLTKTGIALPSTGLHVFNVRIKDNNGVWGPVFRNVINVQATVPVGCWESVRGGVEFSSGIKTDGTLWAWGDNFYSHLGTGGTTDLYVPTQIGIATDWKWIDNGHDTTLAVKNNGTLWGWGINGYGQIGNGNASVQTTPIQIGNANDWQSAISTFDHTVAKKTNGTLWASGYNDYGQLGDGTTTKKSTFIQIGTATNWESYAVGNGHTLAIKSDGTLWAWGNNGSGQLGDGTLINRTVPTQIGTGTNWKSVTTGYKFSVAIKTDGTIWAWGANNSGQLGDGTTTSRSVPTQIGTATDWKSTACSESHTLAIKTNGTLWAWGNNYFRQLGDGTYVDKLAPTQIGTATDWQKIDCGFAHSIGIKTNGTLYTWGRNYNGGLGIGNTNTVTVPTAIACPTSSLAVVEVSAKGDQLKVYPNPVQDYLNVSYDQMIVSVTVYSAAGQLVTTKMINDTKGTIDFTVLASGVYLVKVNVANNTVKTVKVIKR
ncbi:Por secretion system C-terminal sorting domain-containing protein [Chryseobacterium limigenitum]|uniref:Por secretion system C-terminal sorting domain-containing protein n=2 Tax=Chryseobacterium limigenitum TaxID=1612149 RepID=A0A1K2IQL9_9FLAO|nr:Por secretion system C-terminal sorting domain-containing protein [Chryseobacterium limigenitum]